MSLRYRRLMSSYKKAGYKEWWNLDGIITPANCLAAYQPKGAASYTDSLINLANPGTYDLTELAAPSSWDSINGWDGNGTDTELKTGILVDSDGEWSIICRFTGAVTSNDLLFGADDYEGGYRMWGLGFFHVDPDEQRWYTGSQNYVARNPTGEPFDGVMAISYLTAYWNGVDIGDSSGVGNIPTGSGIRFFMGSYSAAFPGQIQAGAAYNTILTAGQISALTTAINLL